MVIELCIVFNINKLFTMHFSITHWSLHISPPLTLNTTTVAVHILLVKMELLLWVSLTYYWVYGVMKYFVKIQFSILVLQYFIKEFGYWDKKNIQPDEHEPESVLRMILFVINIRSCKWLVRTNCHHFWCRCDMNILRDFVPHIYATNLSNEECGAVV
jgi:hypothetical protein